jgi:cell division protein FtsX
VKPLDKQVYISTLSSPESRKVSTMSETVPTPNKNMVRSVEDLEKEISRLRNALEDIQRVADISDGAQWYSMVADKALMGIDDEE